MNSKIKKTLSSLLLVGIGTGIGYYFMPAKVEEKTVEKERVKTITIVREKKNSDGSTEKETIVKEDTKKSNETEKTVKKNNPQWSVSAMVGKDTNWETTMGAAVQKRIFGPFSAGVYVIPAGTRMQGGAIFTYEF